MRALLAALLLLLTACAEPSAPGVWLVPIVWLPQWGPVPGQLRLSNYRYAEAAIEAVAAAGPVCAPADPALPATAFTLPFKGTRVIAAAPNTDICWRRQLASGQWSDWNRAFTGAGGRIDSQL